ncbi:uncharacterized protein LOC6582005 [Drosophila mojavensis]|uniref:Protein phosphatase 1 regulatory subunit 36 n=1 Tax=Drosophila mojavensis TaxID=7230 RepID=B4L137_DROMO|nr:uncharacterized protein LOC6582005 [Drosophila mojavensis]EDW18194.1 uncharacterized protein Dmoj_GI12233 [Drosophila mojavensis]
MKRVHVGTTAPKYHSGKWTWDESSESLRFHPYSDLEDANERFIMTNGFKFLRTINQEEELIYRQVFARPENTFDGDVVVVNDVRDLVLFMMPKEFLSIKFVDFMHRPAVHRLLHALVIYFEYFLRLVEFILIRRDELSGDMAQVQSEQTNEVKRIFSSHLSHFRMLVARNYSVIIKGEGDMQEFYHTKEVVNISSTIRDRAFHEQFLAVATQIIWITMHRRAYFIIEMEMNRLFRSEHFLMNNIHYLNFTTVERSLLYGRNNKIFNCRVQNSPMIQELQHVADEDMPILWIGERQYRGTDLRIAQVEMEYLIPGSQLNLADLSHGILGHPKNLYDTILSLDWPSVRFANFSKQYDPYNLLRQPGLQLPNIDEMQVRRMAKQYDHFYRVFRIYESCSKKMLNNWFNRDKIVQYYSSGGILKNVFMRGEEQLVTEEDRSDINKIVANYFDVMLKLRKQKATTIMTSDTGHKKQEAEFFC